MVSLVKLELMVEIMKLKEVVGKGKATPWVVFWLSLELSSIVYFFFLIMR